ncbi:pyridoxal phosphate-dependent aminotransferase [Patescibacteria group bacterium]|nr:pyridoxal phosphate-dependent aminotransferase [Patescibacteria group bacterium]
MKISNRVSSTISSPLRKFVPYAEAAKKKGIKVYHLNIGQPDLEIPKQIKSKINNFKEDVLAYTHSAGTIELRTAWSKYLKSQNVKIKPEDVIVATGGSEAMLWALLLMLNPGEEMIVFEPFYSNYKSLAKISGVKLVPVTTKVEENFCLSSDTEIKKQITKKTKAILVVNPSNPTGTIYSKKDLLRLVNIAKKNKLWLLADETYRELVFSGKPVYSLLRFPEVKDQVILVDSVSKRLSVCGARIGCLVSHNKEVTANTLKLAQARLASPAIEQQIVCNLLKNCKSYTKQITKEYYKRSQVVYQGLQKIPGVVSSKPAGAFYIIAKLPIDDSEKFVQWMLEKFNHNKETVMVSPAKDFYMTNGKGKNEVRIAYVLSIPKLKRAMELLQLGINQYQKKM